MKNKIVSVVLSSLLLFSMFVPVSAATAYYEVHVSVKGNDLGYGTIKSPYKSIEAAKNKVRNIRKRFGKNAEVVVIFHEGKYLIDNTVVFELRDSGSENARITYKGAEGEKVVFSGAVELDITRIEKVTDAEILSRLPERAKDMVGVLNLKQQGITKEMIPKIPDDASNFQDIMFFLNGEKQPQASWPNAKYDYAEYSIITQGANASGRGGTFQYAETNPLNWTKAENMIAEGYFNGQDYASQRYKIKSIDTSKKEITLAYGSLTSTGSRRWRVTNVLEELDIPGEWYLDRDKMLLYYYPQVSLKNAKFEMAVMSDYLISLEESNYLNFENIIFEKSRSGAIKSANNTNFINIKDCTFRYLGADAITQNNGGGGSMRYADYSASETYSRYSKDKGAMNWIIEGNLFHDLSLKAAHLKGGDMYNFIDSGTKFKNNYISRIAQLRPGSTMAVYMQGYGGTAENNLFHNLPFHAINHDNMQKISYNEFSNVIRDTQDSGAIYSGRSLLLRGGEVSYNYFYNLNPTTKRVKPHNRGIYYDDEMCGVNVHHNIIVNAEKTITYAGSSGKAYANLGVNTVNGFRFTANGSWWTQRQEQKYYNWNDGIKNGAEADWYERWAKKYPEINREYDFFMKTGISEFMFNYIADNVTINGDFQTADYTEERGGVLKNNIKLESFDGFVDPQHYDYRIKKDTQLAKSHPMLLTEDFNIDLIGIQFDKFDKSKVTQENRSFRLVYPQNGAGGIPTSNVTFVWTDALGNDTYKFTLAKDREFKNIVIEDNVYTNMYTIDNLDSNNTVYYWKVTAKNETRQFQDEWGADSTVYSFATSKYPTVTFEELADVYATASLKVKNIKEGTVPGTYRKGTIDNINAQLSKAEKILNNRTGVTQLQIDGITDLIENSFATDRMITGFVNVGDYTKNKENWQEYLPETITVKDDEVSLYVSKDKTGFEAQASLMPVKEMSKSVFFNFKMKADYGGTGNSHWVGLGVRGEPGKIIYSQYNYFVIAKQELLEFQIRSSGLTGIIDTVENNGILKDGQWHDITFGAYDCGFAQLTLLMVDGKVVFNYMDYTKNQLRFEGILTFYTTRGTKISIKPSESTPDNFDAIIAEGIEKAYKEIGREMISYTGDEDAALFVNGNTMYYHKGVENYAKEAPVITGDNEYYIPASVLKELYGDKSPLTIDVNGIKMVSAKEIKEKYGKYIYVENKTLYLTSDQDLYTGDATIPYIFDVFGQVTEKKSAITK